MAGTGPGVAVPVSIPAVIESAHCQFAAGGHGGRT
jgi:hypothetical protein